MISICFGNKNTYFDTKKKIENILKKQRNFANKNTLQLKNVRNKNKLLEIYFEWYYDDSDFP